VDKQYVQRQNAVIRRQRAEIEQLKEENKRLEVQLKIAANEAISYEDFVKYSGHFIL